MSKVIIVTHAYNSEKTLPRTIASVLNQTLENWVWLLIDNASTDSTGELIEKLAYTDKRIDYRQYSVNIVLEPDSAPTAREVFEKYDESDYVCVLDADDEYKPEFLEKMLNFMQDNELDIAACGSDFINQQTEKLFGVRTLEKNIIIEGEGFSQYFPACFQFLRTLWGKLFKLGDLLKYDDSYDSSVKQNLASYGSDTYAVLTMASTAKRIGILAEPLHKYYMSPNSISYRWTGDRIASDRILDDTVRKFLLDKCGIITSQNDNCLNVVYFNAIKDTLKVLVGSQISFGEKIAGLHDVFTSENTQRLIACDGIESEKKQLFKAVAEWIALQQKGMTKEQKKYSLDNPLLTELKIILNRALGKSDEEMFKYLADVKKSRPRVAEKVDINEHICNIMAEYPLLTGMTAETAVFLNNAVCAVLRGDLQIALDEVVSLSDNKVPTEHTESYLMFAQYVCAATEYSEGWLFFKIRLAQFLLDNERVTEAHTAVDELEQLLPNDPDISVLRETLNGF